MPFLDLKAGLALSPECVTVYCSRSGKCDLSCSFRGFLNLQQQIVVIFNVRNVIGTLSYVTVIPASMSLQWPLTNVMEKPFRINTPSGNKEFNGNGKLRKKGTSCSLSLFNSLSHSLTHYLALHELNRIQSCQKSRISDRTESSHVWKDYNLLYKHTRATSFVLQCDDILHSRPLVSLKLFAESISLSYDLSTLP